MIKIIQYFVIIISLFGPKFGIIDSRLLLLLILIFLYKKNEIILNKNELFLFTIIFLLTIYSFILYLIFPPYPDFLRYIRSMVSLFCLPYIINYQNNFEKSLSMLVNILILHPLAIFLSMIVPSFNNYLAMIFDLATQIKELRYNGLTAGFDIAGYLSISGFLICIFIYFYDSKKTTLLKALIFFMSVFFTSRTSIILILLISLLLIFYRLLKLKINLYRIFYFSIIISFLILFFYYYVFPYLISTIDLEVFSNLSDKGNEDAVFIYAKTDPLQMFKDFIILPKTNLAIIFGENFLPLSDSGYIKAINSVGLIGLLISLFFYYKLFFIMRRKFKENNQLRINFSKAFYGILFITILLNAKNQYLFTRGTFELLIIIYIIHNLKSNTEYR